MGKSQSVFSCQQCGSQSPRWLGRCPECGAWNSFVEETFAAPSGGSSSSRRSQGPKAEPILLNALSTEDSERIPSDFKEFDRVLGGGLVAGSVVLVGGDPGIGKSTLLLQAAASYAQKKKNVLYVTGEESAAQIRMRADRLGVGSAHVTVLTETLLPNITAVLESEKPDVVILDSIQSVYRPEITSAPGSVSQVRECAGELLRLVKKSGTPLFLVGHVTKEGALAGPRVLEHLVDTVLYFEGDRLHSYRILRAVKNRYGSTNELGLFAMTEKGLAEVSNPSAIFLEERSRDIPGSSILVAMEGTRPLLLEVQALLTETRGTPRRQTTGLDPNRVNLILAVLESRIGLNVGISDAFVNLTGGVRIMEPAADLAVAVAIASSFRRQAVDPETVFIGELGLSGEVRSVSQIESRVKEAAKLGFKRAFVPKRSEKSLGPAKDFEIFGVSTLMEAFETGLFEQR